MKIYKVLHKPTGLYFTPSRHSSGNRNLSKTGKVYHRHPNIKEWLSYSGRLEYNHPIKEYPYYKREFTKLEDWEVIEGNIG